MTTRIKSMAVGAACIGLAALMLAGCGRSATTDTSSSAAPDGSASASGGESSAAPAPGLATTTPAGTAPLDSVTWVVYRDVAIIDPIYVYDYPDNAAIALLCESLGRQTPDGAIVDGLATLTRPDDKTMVYTINPDAKFWDGSPVTAEDAVFSLQRQTNPDLGGFYGLAFLNVASIEATAPDTVTITLTNPDYTLEGELASIPGMVVQKKFAESAAEAFGTPDAGVMCSGSYTNAGWTVGEGMTLTRNDNYWRSDVKPLTQSIKLLGSADPAAISAGLSSGDIDGTYWTGGTSGLLAQFRADSAITVTLGASYAVDAFITTDNGVLADPVVRKALSLAIDRPAYVASAWEDAAQLPKAITPPATWGYGKEVFAAGYAALPEATPDVEAAKALIADKGVEGKTITIGFIQIPSMAAEANSVKQAAEALGMKAELKAIPADQYINLFIDAEFRKGIDGWFTINYPNYADPMSLLSTIVIPGAPQNYDGYDNPAVTEALTAARSTSDPDARAQLVVDAQKIIMEEVPWIPMSFPDNINLTSSGISGQSASFTYMFAPWADSLGGVG